MVKGACAPAADFGDASMPVAEWGTTAVIFVRFVLDEPSSTDRRGQRRQASHLPIGGAVGPLGQCSVPAEHDSVVTTVPAVYLWHRPTTAGWPMVQVACVQTGRWNGDVWGHGRYSWLSE
jgi:hypothetical protein